MNTFHRLVHPSLPVSLAMLVSAGFVPAQAQETFCPALKRAIEAKAKNFEPLKVKPYHGSTREWDARVNLPGTQACRVDDSGDGCPFAPDTAR